MRRLLPLLLLLAACSHTSPSTVTLRPKDPNGILVVYVHGAGGDASDVRDGPVKALVGPLLNAGYTVTAATAGGDNWGSAASLTTYQQTAERLGFHRTVILAQSMGGLDGLRLVDRLGAVAFAGLFPVCNLASMSSGPFGSRVKKAVGQPPAGLTLPSHLRGLPMIFWASPGDTVVPKAQNTDACAAAARRGGASVTVVQTTGDHADPSNYQPGRLLAFLQRATEQS